MNLPVSTVSRLPESISLPADRPPVGYTAADHSVSDLTRAMAEASVPTNTRTAYERIAREFTAWCAEHGRTPLPATPATLAEYVTHLCATRQLAPSSVEQAIAAIRTGHREAGFENTPDTVDARKVLRSHRQQRAANGARTKQAQPVTIEALRRMVVATDPATLIGKRDRLVLVLGLAMMARRSELVGLDAADVVETEEGLEIYIRQSKTDQDARGVVVAVPRGQHPDTDPVRLLRDYRAALAVHGVEAGPLLRSITRHGKPGQMLSANAVNRIVRSAAERAELPNVDSYTAHSLRAGGATSAYRAGAPVSTIANHGRWQPTSPVVLTYIRSVDRWTDNAMKGVGL